MFSEQKAKNMENTGELIFDDLETKTRKMRVSDEKNVGKEKRYGTSEINEQKKKKSIKKSDQKASSISLNISKTETQSPSSHRSNSVDPTLKDGIINGNMGLGIMEAASMMCNIVDITTDSTNKLSKEQKSKQQQNKGSRGSISAGPFAQLKEAQEQKKRNKNSFDNEESDNS